MKTGSGVNDRISMGAGCLPGRVVFRVFPMVKILPVLVSCIHKVSSFERVCCMVTRASNILRLIVSCFHAKSLRAGMTGDI